MCAVGQKDRINAPRRYVKKPLLTNPAPIESSDQNRLDLFPLALLLDPRILLRFLVLGLLSASKSGLALILGHLFASCIHWKV